MGTICLSTARVDVVEEDDRILHYIDYAHECITLALLDAVIINNSHLTQNVEWAVCKRGKYDGINPSFMTLKPNETIELNSYLINTTCDLHVRRFNGLSITSVLQHNCTEDILHMYNKRKQTAKQIVY